MTNVKTKIEQVTSATWNEEMLRAINVAREFLIPGREVSVKLCAKGLAVVKCSIWCGVTNGERMILPMEFESIEVVENGWIVACKYGIYDLYDEQGNKFRGLSFLKKSNAIKFARDL